MHDNCRGNSSLHTSDVHSSSIQLRHLLVWAESGMGQCADVSDVDSIEGIEEEPSSEVRKASISCAEPEFIDKMLALLEEVVSCGEDVVCRVDQDAVGDDDVFEVLQRCIGSILVELCELLESIRQPMAIYHRKLCEMPAQIKRDALCGSSLGGWRRYGGPHRR